MALYDDDPNTKLYAISCPICDKHVAISRRRKGTNLEGELFCSYACESIDSKKKVKKK